MLSNTTRRFDSCVHREWVVLLAVDYSTLRMSSWPDRELVSPREETGIRVNVDESDEGWGLILVSLVDLSLSRRQIEHCHNRVVCRVVSILNSTVKRTA